MAEPQGTITHVQRFSIHDGPGIRTTVFLKGCNLRCFWCHNPETLRPEPELQYLPERCIGCGECLACCPQGVHAVEDGQRVLRRERCQACGRCAETCFAGALTLVGRRVAVREVLDEVLAERPFYAQSGGGVTLSGGEPLLQVAFSAALLSACRREGVHTALETALAVPWERMARLLPLLDLVMVDIKHMDAERHRQATGADNGRILANVERLGRERVPVIVRTPVVPGVNDSEAEIAAIARFASRLPNLDYYELLPFHPMAGSKYASLGLAYDARTLPQPTAECLEALTEAARREGVDARHR